MRSKLPRVKQLTILLLLISTVSFSQKDWKTIVTVSDLYEAYPEKLERLLEQIDLDYQGLEAVKKAYNNEDVIGACESLLRYYKNGNSTSYLRRDQPEESSERKADADTILKNVFTVQNVKGKVPIGNDGHRDWYYKGPNQDEEWAWLSNRHSQINNVLSTYFATGNTDYVNYIDLFLRDFIIKSAPYPGVKSNTSVWRGLEVAARAKVWSRIFFNLLNSDSLMPATQLLILSSLSDHAHYSRNFHLQNNWLTMEISSLATTAANFPEFKESSEWLDYSIQTMVESMKKQVYKDGTQTELTSHYHYVALANFELFKRICDGVNRKLPDFFNQTIIDMYDYLARTMRPNGFRILNNDGDLGSDRKKVLNASERFSKPEWKFITTNEEFGDKPKVGPSYFYPWAGQLISRNGYHDDAHWSFFDIGPWGSGHQHDDKLHISIHAYGRDLLVDAGRFAYKGEVAKKFRSYAKSTSSHNLVLVDGKGHNSDPKLAKSPLDNSYFKITEAFDYASNSFDDFENVKGEFKHTRVMFYLRGEYWVIVDRLISDRPREINTLWHWHPDNIVKQKNQMVATYNQKGNLAVIPVGKRKFSVKLTEGQEFPEPQGWYSSEYNKYESNVVSEYKTSIDTTTTFVWILYPSEKEIPKVRARIVSENGNEVILKVKSKRKKTTIKIPFSSSENVEIVKE